MQNLPIMGITKPLILLVLLYSCTTKAELLLNGIATHSRFEQEQFLAAIYTTDLTSDESDLLESDDARALEVRIIDQQIFPRRFQRMWIEGVAINANDQELEQYAQMMADFSNMLTVQLRPGDIFRVESDPVEGVSVVLNDVQLGRIDDPGFIDLLLRSWVGPVPLSSDFKAFLLAAGTVDGDLRRRFTNITPSEERKTLIAATHDSSTQQPQPQSIGAAQAPSANASASPQPTQPQATALPTAADNQSEPMDGAGPLPEEEQQDAGDSQSHNEELSEIAASADPIKDTAGSDKDPLTTTAALMRRDDQIVLPLEEEQHTTSAESILSEQRYLTQLIRWTQSFAKYPKLALRRGREGTVRLTVTLNRYGQVKRINYEEKARFDILNEAAEQAIKDASPYPSMPSGVNGREFQFTVPIIFNLK